MALELDALPLKEMGRGDEAAILLARSLTLRQQLVREMNLPALDDDPPLLVVQGISPPQVISKLEPAFTETPRQIGLKECWVGLSFTVGRDGRPSSMELKKSCGLGLDEAAATAVRQWRFRPAMFAGAAGRAIANVQVKFGHL